MLKMNKMKFLIVAACLLSACVASAAITYDTIDFESPSLGNLDSTAHDGLASAKYAVNYLGQGVSMDRGPGYRFYTFEMEFTFSEAVRFTSIDLGTPGGNSPSYNKLYVWGLGGMDESGNAIVGNAELYGSESAPTAMFTWDFSDPKTYSYTGLRITSTHIGTRIDNINYNFGVKDPDPVPVPAPGGIVLAGIGTFVASWMKKRKMA
jgi:hypothetical protein